MMAVSKGVVLAGAIVAISVGAAGCDLLNEPTPEVSLQIEPRLASLAPGESITLQVRVEGGSIDWNLLGWQSYRPEVATVDNDGNVAAVAPGIATIAARYWTGAREVASHAEVAVGTVRFDNVREHMVREFAVWGLEIGSPPITMDSTAVDTNQARSATHFVANVYRENDVHTVHIWPDGKVSSYLVCSVAVRPWGEIRVALVVVDHGNTNMAALLSKEWPSAQDSVNQDFEHWARKAGLNTAPVRFRSVNLLATPEEIPDPQSIDSVRSYLARKGLLWKVDYDIAAVLNMDAEVQYGWAGWASPFAGFAFAQCHVCSPYDQGTVFRLNAAMLDSLAQTLYHHEIGHVMGWSHHWRGGPAGTRIITNPALFGWTDTDGDSIPEMADPTPYGAPRGPRFQPCATAEGANAVEGTPATATRARIR